MQNINILDSPTHRQLFDPSEMAVRISGIARQCQEAWDAVFALELPEGYQKSNQMVVAGMGGSGIGGDLLSNLALTDDSAPICVWRDYNLPPWVNNQTLVVASSYSGNTEETLSAFQAGRSYGCNLIALTRGGYLEKLATESGSPLLTIKFNGEPRTALGYSFIAPLALAIRLKLMAETHVSNLERTIKRLGEITAIYNPTSPLEKNPAKKLAGRLFGHKVVIYASNPLSAAARRWKTQINENAKTWAFAETLPELQHNSIVGYENPKDESSKVFVVLLESNTSDPRVLLRHQIVKEFLENGNVEYQSFEFKESNSLENMLHAILLGDFTSYYLALLNQIDPAPVPAIDHLKERIARS
jgi:glucose/mannose-6-phosphate isomerase